MCDAPCGGPAEGHRHQQPHHQQPQQPHQQQQQQHRTPPPRLTAGRVRNPFERALIERLNTHVCSPGMFKIRKSTDDFKWDIEQASILKPAEIVPCSSQFDPTPDPVLERKATEAIDKYFSQDLIVPSPFDVPPKRIALPKEPEYTPEGSKLSARAQAQLSFPVESPPEDDVDAVANASLRRKLNFEAQFSDEDEATAGVSNVSNRGVKRVLDTSIESYTSIEIFERSKIPTSPIFKGQVTTRCDFGTHREHFKSPSVSPIKRTNSSPESFEDKSHRNISISSSQSTPEKFKNFGGIGLGASKIVQNRIVADFMKENDENMDVSDVSAYFSKNHSLDSQDLECPPEYMSTDNPIEECVQIQTKPMIHREALRNIVNIVNDKKARESPSLTPKKNRSHAMETSRLLESDNAVNLTVQDMSCGRATRFGPRVDSGFLETFYGDCFKAQTKNNGSSVRWKRFDSGFHDEASSEIATASHVGSNDSTSKSSRSHDPIDEYLEDRRDLENFEDFNRFLARKDEPAALTGVGVHGSVVNCNFSSTPSKSQYKRRFM